MKSHDDIYFAVYVDNDYAKIPDITTQEINEETGDVTYITTYKACVRALKSPASELYFFFGDLRNGGDTPHNFSDYVVKEVQLTKKTDKDCGGYAPAILQKKEGEKL